MEDKELHPVRFTKKQVRFIERMIHGKVVGKESKDIFSTIEKSIIKGNKPLTEGKTKSCVKEYPITKRPLRPPPPGRRKTKAKKCYHLNIRFKDMSPEICPDCHRNVWPSDLINVLLDLMHVHPHSKMPVPWTMC